ncbi:hypothetical protein TrVE_jg4072 [Triparma verrucosa]|uniref:Uncharacterized protein n=1 Tax=Triparma verrucosa TaxID=1606542 RepID=A0A9W7BDL3_9STRA|nr:hypothetical protein TrVE_jg4072 [Triparma verrucosa]
MPAGGNDNKKDGLPVQSCLSSIAHGRGSIIYSTHPYLPLVASCGSSKVIQISSSLSGETSTSSSSSSSSSFTSTALPDSTVIDQIIPPSPTPVHTLTWSPSGSHLASLQTSSSLVTIFDLDSRKTRSIEAHSKDLSFVKFGSSGESFAVGTGKGVVSIYDLKTGTKKATVTPNSNSNKSNKRASLFTGQDCFCWQLPSGDVMCCDWEGVILQVWDKVTRTRENVVTGEGWLAVKTSDKSISAFGPNNSTVELNFPSEHGKLISFVLDRSGLTAAFSKGFIVRLALGTFEEIFTGKFLTNREAPLVDLAVLEEKNLMAAVSKDTVKVVCLAEGAREVLSVNACSRSSMSADAPALDVKDCISAAEFAASGSLLVGTAEGNLYLVGQPGGAGNWVEGWKDSLMETLDSFPTSLTFLFFLFLISLTIIGELHNANHQFLK